MRIRKNTKEYRYGLDGSMGLTTLTAAEEQTISGGERHNTYYNPTTGQTVLTNQVFVESGFLLIGSTNYKNSDGTYD